MRVQEGRATPLGATWDGEGTNFSLFSEQGTRVELCLFEPTAASGVPTTVELAARTGDVWHGWLGGIGPGQGYGFRVHGPFAPREGQRFNPAKLLIDPYARAIDGRLVWHETMQGAREGDENAPDLRDSAAFVPKGVVVDGAFDWEGDRRPGRPWNETFIYECHVKGLTARHPDVPDELRGTYLGLASPPVIEHLHRLGVTAVELLPVHAAMTERRLVERGLTNYWGYNTIGFFAPDCRFASGADGTQVVEFKRMVKALHAAGIEVILDVVYNHTGEADHEGPTVCFRGIDNRAYYLLRAEDRSRYVDVTGCGNSIHIEHPGVVRMVMDSLRYWVEEMHVDGFRFDLATTLARTPRGVDPRGGFFEALRCDAVLSQMKLIVEPWDVGADGYQLGRFPPGYAEWNDKYRDTVRRFWRGDGGQAGAFASRVSGSSDVFEAARGPLASVNFVAAHDGFTLRDLVSFERKYNLANGEQNRDGAEINFSRNWGAEGDAADPAIAALRERTLRNLLATLALSQGIPMLAAGDEMGRTQRGNNNAYCQDNETSWVNWELWEGHRRLLAFTQAVMALRRAFACLRRDRFFQGEFVEHGVKDVTWVRPDGQEMTASDWVDPGRHAFGMLIHCGAARAMEDAAFPVAPTMLLILFNGGAALRPWTLPRIGVEGRWRLVMGTSVAGANEADTDEGKVAPHSVRLFAYELWGSHR